VSPDAAQEEEDSAPAVRPCEHRGIRVAAQSAASSPGAVHAWSTSCFCRAPVQRPLAAAAAEVRIAYARGGERCSPSMLLLASHAGRHLACPRLSARPVAERAERRAARPDDEGSRSFAAGRPWMISLRGSPARRGRPIRLLAWGAPLGLYRPLDQLPTAEIALTSRGGSATRSSPSPRGRTTRSHRGSLGVRRRPGSMYRRRFHSVGTTWPRRRLSDRRQPQLRPSRRPWEARQGLRRVSSSELSPGTVVQQWPPKRPNWSPETLGTRCAV